MAYGSSGPAAHISGKRGVQHPFHPDRAGERISSGSPSPYKSDDSKEADKDEYQGEGRDHYS